MYTVLGVLSVVASILSIIRAVRYFRKAEVAISENSFLEYRRAQDQYWFSLILFLLSLSAVVGFLSMAHFLRR